MNYLKYLIKSKELSIDDTAKALGMTKQTFYRKLNGKIGWLLKDMKCLKELLAMSDDDIKKVFDI